MIKYFFIDNITKLHTNTYCNIYFILRTLAVNNARSKLLNQYCIYNLFCKPTVNKVNSNIVGYEQQLHNTVYCELLKTISVQVDVTAVEQT